MYFYMHVYLHMHTHILYPFLLQTHGLGNFQERPFWIGGVVTEHHKYTHYVVLILTFFKTQTYNHVTYIPTAEK